MICEIVVLYYDDFFIDYMLRDLHDDHIHSTQTLHEPSFVKLPPFHIFTHEVDKIFMRHKHVICDDFLGI